MKEFVCVNDEKMNCGTVRLTTIEEKMVIVSLLRTPALLSVVDNGQ